MRKSMHYLTTTVLFLILALLIFDTRTAIFGAGQGVDLCLKTLIPALFPFLVVATACSKILLGSSTKLLTLVTQPCKIPKGTESIFLLGILGGYPVGAKLICDAYKSGTISKADANRMLMFSSNAGPAFIFGVMGSVFAEAWVPWLIWIIHILSAYLVGILTSEAQTGCASSPQTENFQFAKAVTDAVETIGKICGWVIVFRTIIAFLDKWFLRKLPLFCQALFWGVLELSNGSVRIQTINNCGLRFLVGLLIITFGGLCVTMQTASVLSGLSLKHYLTGKLYQCLFATTIALPLQAILFSASFQAWAPAFVILVVLTGIVISKQIVKKTVAFRKQIVYNTEKAKL